MMAGLIARRLGLGLVTLLLVSVLVFAGTEILPGDVAAAVLGQDATPESLRAFREALRLDRPAHERFVEWLGALITGDLGRSLASGRSVAELVAGRLHNTIMLAGLTAVVVVPLSVALGLLAAIRPHSLFDRAVNVGGLLLISFPEFLTAYLLVALFSIGLGVLPAIAYLSSGMDWVAQLRAIALPVLTLTLATLAHMMRMTRTAVLNVLGTTYVEMALLKGASASRIVVRHALPNAAGPIINVIALNLGFLVVGVIVVEVAFAYSGMGQLFVDAVTTRDIPLVQSCAMIFAITYVGLNLVADILAIAVNPRLRHPR